MRFATRLSRVGLGIVLLGLVWASPASAQCHVRVNGVDSCVGLTIVSPGVLKLPDGTAAAPSLTFASATTMGLHLNSGFMAVSVSGVETFEFGGSNFAILNGEGLSFSGSTRGAQDVFLARDAANTPACRNGTNACTLRVYGTFTDASNYERFSVKFDSGSGNFVLGSENAGTGSDRGLFLSGKYALRFGIAGGALTTAWQIGDSSAGGNFIAGTTNTYDIGTSATVAAPRTVYAGTSMVTPTMNATSAFQANGTPGVSGTCDTPTFITGIATTCGGSGGSVDGTYFVTSNFTTAANTNLQTITGLTWTFPANTAISVPFQCSLVYSQATAAVADSIGIQDVTVAPTNGMFASTAETTLTAVAFGDLTAFSSTTATAVNTFTPGAIGTTYNIELDGFIEQPSNASTSAFNVMIKTSNSADVITIYRGSYCKVG